MKKIQTIVLVIVIGVLVLSANAQATDNWLFERLEFGERVASGESYVGTYTIFENNSIEGMSLGTKVVTGQKGYKLLNPYVLKNIIGGWQLGAKYSSDSARTETLGPSVRFKGKVGKVFVILDYVHDFDLRGGKSSKNDCWLFLNTTNPRFNIGGEAWFFDYMGGSTNWHVRPIRLSYKFGANFFIMSNFCLKDGELISRSIMTGFDIKF